MEEKKQFKKWEKIFITISCCVIAISFFVYLYRLIHYYRIEHVKYKTNTLIQELAKHTVSTGDGLYILDEDNYFFKGEKVSNYVWYSGNLYRIVSISGTDIKLITDSNLTIISWGPNTKFSESYLYTWLNSTEENNIFLNSVSNYSVFLKEFNYCNSAINKQCINKDKYLASALTRSEYLNAGGKLSYLNNESNYWIIDDTSEVEKAYVFKEGGIGSEDENALNLVSFGVRPVITINGNLTNYVGKGTLEEPYIIKEDTLNTLNDKKIGEYVSYKGYKFRISGKYENGVKLVTDKKLENVKIGYNNINTYLSNTFAPKFSNFGTCTYYTNPYGSKTKYDYNNVYQRSKEDKIGIQTIGDLFLGDDDNYWLYTFYDANNELSYKLSSNSTIIADTKGTLNGIRPVICLNKDMEITKGNGTINNPYILGE